MNWRIIYSGSNNGKYNMDSDILLAGKCDKEEAILRFYQWKPYCISLGANQNESEINIEKAKHDNIDVVFRPTGGRAILHAEELTYSVIYPVENSFRCKNLYKEINVAILKGLVQYNHALSKLEMENIQPDFPNFYKGQLASLCFAVPAKSEIKLNGRKLVGSAQKKMQHNVLQHGSILCGNYHIRIVDYLNMPQEVAAEMKEKLSAKTTDLFTILNQQIDYSRLMNCIKLGFEDQFNFKFEEKYAQASEVDS
ncbi:MAG: lipoate--protein ligase family protein [Ignavibacteriaceae bacterium]|nr:lipoate--protein ligase family protein [Ignavibacteriaceae bacterium]